VVIYIVLMDKVMVGTNSGLRKSLQILLTLAHKNDGVPFTELKKSCGNLPPATLSRLLKVLAEEGWCKKAEDGQYYPAGNFRLAADEMCGLSNREKFIQRRIAQLAQDTRESAALVEWNDIGYITFRNKHEIGGSFRYMNIGNNNNGVYVHGFAMLGLAFANHQAQHTIYANYPGTIEERDSFVNKLLECRKKGFIIAQDQSAIRVVSAVLDKSKTFIGACGISMLIRELSTSEEDNYLAQVMQAAQDIGSYF